jgi:hypothetical protein
MGRTALALFEFSPTPEKRPDIAAAKRALTPDLGRAERERRVVDFPAVDRLAALALKPGVRIPENERITVLGEDGFGPLDGALCVLRGLKGDGVQRVREIPVKHTPQLLESVAGERASGEGRL